MTTKCCAYAFGAKAIPAIGSSELEVQQANTAIAALPDRHTGELLTRLFDYRNYWLRSPHTWRRLGTHLRQLDRPVTIWVGGSWTGREGFSAALTCEHAGVPDYRVIVHDTNITYIAESAGPRGGRFKTDEINRDLPAWAHQYFDVDHGQATASINQHIRNRVSFATADFTRDQPPACDVAIVSDIWRRPTAAERQEQAKFPHRDLPLLNLAERRALAARIHHRLRPDGILMLGTKDCIDFRRLDYQRLATGQTSGAAHYDPPPPITELFTPLEEDGPHFQLLWRKRPESTVTPT